MDAAHEWTDGEIKALEKRLAKEYKQAVKEMRQKQAKLMKDFEREKSQRLKALDNTKEAKEQYERWLTNQLATQQWTQDLIEQLSQDAVKANQAAAKTISDAIPRVYAENANYAAYTVEKSVGKPMFNLVNESGVRALVKDSDLLPVVNVPKDLKWNRQKFTSAITQSVLQGESIPNTAKRLESVFEMDKNSAFRAARTSMTGAENAGRNDTFHKAKDMGIELKIEWMAIHDERTRDSHRMLDGVQVDVGEPFKGELSEIRYPGDPHAHPGEIYNCRCTTGGVIPGYGRSAQERFDLRKKELEARGIDVSGMSYEEWKAGKQEYIGLSPIRQGDEIIDDIETWYLPASTKEKVEYFESLKSFDDFERHFAEKGITLTSDLQDLTTSRRFDDIDAVREQCQKIAVAVDAYEAEFGLDALSKLKRINLYDNELDEFAAYHFNRIGEHDPLAGTIRFRQWGADGRTIFHELAHAYQDSMALDGEDAVSFAERMVRKAKLDPKFAAYSGASSDVLEAERFADAFGFGFSKGKKEGLSFIENVKDESRKASPIQTGKSKSPVLYGRTGNMSASEYEKYKKELKKVSELPQLRLPKDEYAHVMSELNTHLSDRDRELPLVHKPIGDFVYTFRNNGFNEYIIIKKTPID